MGCCCPVGARPTCSRLCRHWWRTAIRISACLPCRRRARFHAPEPDTKVRQSSGGDVSWLDWQEASALGDGDGRIYRLDLDLDGTGQPQVLLSRVSPHSWRGDNHSAYVLPSAAALQTIMAQPGGLTAAVARFNNRQREPAAATDPVLYYPQAQLAGAPDNQEVNTGSVWDEHRLLQWRQRYEPGHNLYNLAYAPITEALLRFDATALRHAIEAFQAEAHNARRQKNLSVFLHDAVEWVAGMDMLLAAGANPNYQPALEGSAGFGKTPLMTAAHLNRPDTVRRRLAHGADPRVQDSQGNGLSVYLALNPRLSEAEKRLDMRAFVQAKRQAYSAAECEKATESLARHLCENDILRMLEGEMADAMARWHSVGGEAAQDEQRRWLRARQQACQSGEPGQNIGCLQQLMRARVRYLHNRLAEIVVGSNH